MSKYIVTGKTMKEITVGDIIQRILDNFESRKLDKKDCECLIELEDDEYLHEEFNESKSDYIGEEFENENLFLSELEDIVMNRFNIICYGNETEFYK